MRSLHQFLVIGAMGLMGLLSLTFQRTSSDNDSASLMNEAVIYASGYSQSLMDEIQTKAFDEKTKSTSVTKVDSLSLVLGPDGETYAQFDDIDDYHGYAHTDTLSRLGTFRTGIRVHYVSTMSPDTKSLLRTFSKRIELQVFNSYLPDTLSVMHVVSY